MSFTDEVREVNLSLELLDEVVALAYQAGRAILGLYTKVDLGVQKKSDSSPVTEADMQSDQIIDKGLKKLQENYLNSEIPIVSEESLLSLDGTLETIQNAQVFWVVDPLDGTRDFIAKTGDFAVCIALVQAGKPVLGVVHCPWHKITLGAVKDLGAFSYHNERRNSKKLHCRTFDFEAPCTFLVSRFHTPKIKETLEKNFPGCTLKVAGSAYKYSLIALGEADFSLRRSPTSLWDIAASQCILEEAGGGIINFEGAALTYNHGTLINPALIAHGAIRDSKQREHMLARIHEALK